MGVLDIIGIAVDVNQSAQMYKARQQLQRIEIGSLQESARKQVLEGLRNFVFTVGQNLKTLEQYLDTAPQTVYVSTKMLSWRFKDIGISQEIFPEFIDKEYLQQVTDKLNMLSKAAQERLPKDQLVEAEECFDGIIDMPNLDEAIKEYDKFTITQQAQAEAQIQLSSTDAEWDQLTQKKRTRNLVGAALICAAFLAFKIPLLLILLVGIGFLLAVTGGKDYSRLAQLRRELEQKIAKPATHPKQAERYGNDWNNLAALRAKREKVIFSVMNQIQGHEKLLATSSEDGEFSLALGSGKQRAAHIIPGDNGTSWTCSNCNKYIRHDAEVCRHCKVTFS